MDMRRPVEVCVRLGQGEMWCRRCGCDGSTSQARDGRELKWLVCGRCGSRDLVVAAEILQQDEFVVAN